MASPHHQRRLLSLLCFGISVGGVLFHCSRAVLNEWWLNLVAVDHSFLHMLHGFIQKPLGEQEEVDFPPVAALGIALLLRQQLRLGCLATALAFGGSFLILNAVLPASQFPTITMEVMGTLLLFNGRTALLVGLLLHGHHHIAACGDPKQWLLQALPAEAALEPSLRSPVLATFAPFLVAGGHLFCGPLSPTAWRKYVVLGALGLQQLLDWGAVYRWCRCGAWGLGAGVPVAVAVSLCLFQEPRVHEAALYVLFTFALRRVLPLPASLWLQLVVVGVLLRSFGGPAGLFPHLGTTILQVLVLTLIHQLSLELMKAIVRRSRTQTAHQDVDVQQVEQRSQAMVYAFSKPKQAGKMWSFPAGKHRWGLWQRWCGYQCRSLSIPNGMEVALQLRNGVMRSFQARDNVDALPELPVTGLEVRDSKSLERCQSPPSWALAEADDSEDDTLLTVQTPHITSEQYRIRGQIRTEREVSRLRRSPEYIRHRRRIVAQALRLDIPVVLCAVAQFWFAADAPFRNTVTLLCATWWAGEVLLQ